MERAAAAGSIVSGVVASVSCIGPLLFSMLGISGVAVAHRFAPLRPYFLVLTYALLAGAFYWTYRPQAPGCGPGQTCEMPRTNRLGKIKLWAAAVVVLLTTTFPWYSQYLF
jgi:hypothetical protein